MNEYENKILRIRSKYFNYFISGANIVDIGCGDCVLLDMLNKSGFNVVGVDNNIDSIKKGISKGLNVVHADAIQFLTEHQSKFDGIICSHVLEHIFINEVDDFITVCNKALKPGGAMLILTPNVSLLGGSASFWNDPKHIRPYNLISIERLLRKANFNLADKGYDRDTKITVEGVQNFVSVQ